MNTRISIYHTLSWIILVMCISVFAASAIIDDINIMSLIAAMGWWYVVRYERKLKM